LGKKKRKGGGEAATSCRPGPVGRERNLRKREGGIKGVMCPHWYDREIREGRSERTADVVKKGVLDG